MTETQDHETLPGSAQWMLTSLEPQVKDVAETMTRRVQSALTDLAGPVDGRRYRLIYTAIHNAMRVFIDRALGRSTPMTALDDLFRKMGYREAGTGRDRTTIERALHLVQNELWDLLRVLAADNELSAGALNAVGEMLSDFFAHLDEQLALGHESGTTDRNQDVGVARDRLIDLLLTGGDPDAVSTQASIARWEVPERITVAAIDVDGEGELEPGVLGREAIVGKGRPQLVLCDAAAFEDVSRQIKEALPRTRITHCWPIAAADVAEAWKWVTRAVELVHSHVIPKRPVIDCARYRTEIWLHAEPVMRRQLAQELLEPLFAESENSREILSETLLVWLETRESAPAIAAKLGVHPQTVRYRWKRINELFGEALHDPDFVIQLTLVLKASVPLWIAGDQSDFQLYRSTRER
ncbi:helix-turn-helix domain-containing protein [Nocardioides ginsengisoli]|uniref:Helix-turn-helix domain-containing protein n=1 Tax=Nocardioides ginsengisoli TaxID=363868 RepID=A0ABW3W0I9_9ACTN